MKSRFLHSLISILLLCGTVSAGTIQLTTTTDIPQISMDGEINATLTIRNSGNEVARNVYVEFIAPENFLMNGFKMGDIGPDDSKSEPFSIMVPEGNKGTYPLIVKVIYSDQASYSFSNIAPAYIPIGETRPSRVQINVEDARIPVEGSARITATFTNLEESGRDVVATLIFPDEFRVDDGVRTFYIGGKESKSVVYQVRHISGIESSFYVGAVVAEYDEEGVKHTVIRQLMAEITPQEPSDMIYPLLATLFIALVLLFWIRFRR